MIIHNYSSKKLAFCCLMVYMDSRWYRELDLERIWIVIAYRKKRIKFYENLKAR